MNSLDQSLRVVVRQAASSVRALLLRSHLTAIASYIAMHRQFGDRYRSIIARTIRANFDRCIRTLSVGLQTARHLLLHDRDHLSVTIVTAVYDLWLTIAGIWRCCEDELADADLIVVYDYSAVYSWGLAVQAVGEGVLFSSYLCETASLYSVLNYGG